MSALRKKIATRLEALEDAMKAQHHLGDQEARNEIKDQIDSVAKFWSVLTDGDRDFVNAVRLAVKDQRHWT